MNNSSRRNSSRRDRRIFTHRSRLYQLGYIAHLRRRYACRLRLGEWIALLYYRLRDRMNPPHHYS
jgi:hypothetical protein